MILMSLCSKFIYETNFLEEELESVLLGCHTHGTGEIGMKRAQTLGNLLTKRTGERKTLEVVSIRASCWCCPGGEPLLVPAFLIPCASLSRVCTSLWSCPCLGTWPMEFFNGKRAEISPELVVEPLFPPLSNSQSNSSASSDLTLTLQGLPASWTFSAQRGPGNSSFSWESQPRESLANVHLALEQGWILLTLVTDFLGCPQNVNY